MKKEGLKLFVLSILFLMIATVAHAQGNKITLDVKTRHCLPHLTKWNANHATTRSTMTTAC